MSKQIRSAELLVTKALSSKDTLEAIKNDPEATLKQLQSEVTTSLPQALQPADSKTSNAVWLIIILTVSAILAWTGYILGIGLTKELLPDKVYAVDSDKVLLLFSSALSFLAGTVMRK